MTHLIRKSSDKILSHIKLVHKDKVCDFRRNLLKFVTLDAKIVNLCELTDGGRKSLDLVATKVKTLEGDHTTDFRSDFNDLVICNLELTDSGQRGNLEWQISEVVVAEQETDDASQARELRGETVVLERVLPDIERLELTEVADEGRHDLDTAAKEIEFAHVDEIADIVRDATKTEVITEVEISKGVERAEARNSGELKVTERELLQVGQCGDGGDLSKSRVIAELEVSETDELTDGFRDLGELVEAKTKSCHTAHVGDLTGDLHEKVVSEDEFLNGTHVTDFGGKLTELIVCGVEDFEVLQVTELRGEGLKNVVRDVEEGE